MDLIKIRAQGEDFGMCIGVLLRKEVDGTQMIAKPIEYRPELKGECLAPTERLKSSDATELMNDLWAAGIRPTINKGYSGDQGKHLSDMRKIVAAKLKIVL